MAAIITSTVKQPVIGARQEQALHALGVKPVRESVEVGRGLRRESRQRLRFRRVRFESMQPAQVGLQPHRLGR